MDADTPSDEGAPTREDVRLTGSSSRDEIYADAFSAAGSTTIAGDVDAITADCKGSTTIRGDCRVREFSAAGSTRIGGDASFAEASTSGSTHVTGALDAEDLSTSGSTAVEGPLTARRASFPGSATLATVEVEYLSSAGSLTADSVVADTVDAAGAFSAESVTATEFDLRLGGADSTIGTIEAERVRIEPGDDGGIELPDLDLGGLGGKLADLVSRFGALNGEGRLTADRIAGDVVTLEAVTADVVEGRTVTLGPDCEVGTVRADELEQHPDAEVGTLERAEAAS